MKAARYINWRINRQVNSEDTVLIARVQAGMHSRSFTVGPLSDEEVCLKSFCRKMRALIPEARLHHPPASGWSQRAPATPRSEETTSELQSLMRTSYAVF